MSYKTIEDLPADMRRVLPKVALEAYLKAYNEALEDFKNPVKRRFGDPIEDVASRIAWIAVKKKFVKDDLGSWVKR
jgi:cation transport regulator